MLPSTSKPTIPTLLTFSPCFSVRSPSPFTLKVEALLSLAQVPYTCRYSLPKDGPRGKLPVLLDDGEVIPDSRLIRRHLETKYRIDFNRGLTADQRSTALALQRTCEEHLYWAQTYFRWTDHKPRLRDGYFGEVPRPFRGLITSMVHRQVRRDLHGQGIGRMSRNEVIDLATEDLKALARQLGDKPFMFGDAPTALDAVAYGLLANVLVPELPSPMSEVASGLFGDYTERFAAQVFGGGADSVGSENAMPALPQLRTA